MLHILKFEGWKSFLRYRDASDLIRLFYVLVILRYMEPVENHGCRTLFKDLTNQINEGNYWSFYI